MTIGERIRELRKAKKLTQQEFADEIGTTRDNIAGYETGRREPSMAVISLIVMKLNVSEGWLRTGEGEMFQQACEAEALTLGERVKSLRKALDLTQQKFGRRISIKQNSVAQIEMGRNTSEQTIAAICREFDVNEEWLRTGEGEMFRQDCEEDELSAAVHKLLSGESTEFKTRLIRILADLGPREWDILESYALKLFQDKPAEP